MKLKIIAESDYEGLPDEDHFGPDLPSPPDTFSTHNLARHLLNDADKPLFIKLDDGKVASTSNLLGGYYYGNQYILHHINQGREYGDFDPELEIAVLDCDYEDGEIDYY